MLVIRQNVNIDTKSKFTASLLFSALDMASWKGDKLVAETCLEAASIPHGGF